MSILTDFTTVAADTAQWLARTGLGDSAHARALNEVAQGNMNHDEALAVLEGANDWIIRIGRRSTAHQRELADVIARAAHKV